MSEDRKAILFGAAAYFFSIVGMFLALWWAIAEPLK